MGLRIFVKGDEVPYIPEDVESWRIENACLAIEHSDNIEYYPLTSIYCFESSIWNFLINKNVVLKTLIRQSEPLFQKCMEEARIGKLSKDTIKLLESSINKNIDTKL